ncbi:UNVERIFIED_CONTAM: hypothetical protein K2H54_060245 [Gekko kuhli]
MVVCLVIFFMKKVCLCTKKVEKHCPRKQFRHSLKVVITTSPASNSGLQRMSHHLPQSIMEGESEMQVPYWRVSVGSKRDTRSSPIHGLRYGPSASLQLQLSEGRWDTPGEPSHKLLLVLSRDGETSEKSLLGLKKKKSLDLSPALHYPEESQSGLQTPFPSPHNRHPVRWVGLREL